MVVYNIKLIHGYFSTYPFLSRNKEIQSPYGFIRSRGRLKGLPKYSQLIPFETIIIR